MSSSLYQIWVQDDTMHDVDNVIKIMENEISLCNIDNELHVAHGTITEHVNMKSLHSYFTHMLTTNAILVLEHARTKKNDARRIKCKN